MLDTIASYASSKLQINIDRHYQVGSCSLKSKRDMPRNGHADATISFFLRPPVGVLKISRGVEHVPESERDGESSKNIDLKNRFLLEIGNVQTANDYFWPRVDEIRPFGGNSVLHTMFSNR